MKTDLNTDLQIQDLETNYTNEKIPEDSIKRNPLDPSDVTITLSKNSTIAWDKIQIILYSFLTFIVVSTVIATIFFSVKKLSQKHSQTNIKTFASESEDVPEKIVFSSNELALEVTIPEQWQYLEVKDDAYIFGHITEDKKIHIVPVKIDEYLLKPQLEKATGLIAEYCTRQSSLLTNISCTAKIISLENKSNTSLPTYHADLVINDSSKAIPARILKHQSNNYDTIILMSTDPISDEEINSFSQSIAEK